MYHATFMSKRCPQCDRTFSDEERFCSYDAAELQLVENSDPLVGQLFDGRFRVEERIGDGGMGVVYRAVHLKIDREVALKLMHPSSASQPRARKRFLREAKATSRLTSSHSVTLYDFGVTDDGTYYIVMEYLRGRTLQRLLEDGPLDTAMALSLLEQITDSLSEAHALGIVHRDLKPSNVFIAHTHGGEEKFACSTLASRRCRTRRS